MTFVYQVHHSEYTFNQHNKTTLSFGVWSFVQFSAAEGDFNKLRRYKINFPQKVISISGIPTDNNTYLFRESNLSSWKHRLLSFGREMFSPF